MTATAAIAFERSALTPECFNLRREPGNRCDAAAAAGIEFDVVTTREAFDALEADWNGLFERSATSAQLFQTFNWNWHWCNHYLGTTGPRLAILVGRRNGRAVMIWPLVAQRIAGLRQLSWMGEPVSQYGDVLIEADTGAERTAMLASAWHFILRAMRPDTVNLRKVRADAHVSGFLETIGAGITQSLVAPYLDLSGAKDFAQYEKRYSGDARRNRKRLMRRLEEKHTVAFVEHGSGKSARDLAAAAVDLKIAWIKDRALVSPALADPRFREFFADIAEGATKPAGCRISALMADGAPVALEIAVGAKDRIAMHVIVHDRAHEKSAVGVLLVEHTIRTALEAGYRCYDMLAPGAAYKDMWSDGSLAVNDWAFASTIPGKLYTKVYLGFVRRNAKALVHSLPVSLRRRLLG